MSKRVLVLDLRNDPEAIAAYRYWHRPGGPPEAVTRAIRAGGVTSLDIWNVGDRLVMLMETAPDFDPAANAARDAGDPEVQVWDVLMDQYQRRLPFAADGEKWVEAEQIYSLDEQP